MGCQNERAIKRKGSYMKMHAMHAGSICVLILEWKGRSGYVVGGWDGGGGFSLIVMAPVFCTYR